jgi:hypothetical protein
VQERVKFFDASVANGATTLVHHKLFDVDWQLAAKAAPLVSELFIDVLRGLSFFDLAVDPARRYARVDSFGASLRVCNRGMAAAPEQIPVVVTVEQQERRLTEWLTNRQTWDRSQLFPSHEESSMSPVPHCARQNRVLEDASGYESRWRLV